MTWTVKAACRAVPGVGASKMRTHRRIDHNASIAAFYCPEGFQDPGLHVAVPPRRDVFQLSRSSFRQVVDRPNVDPWTLFPLQSGREHIARERYGEPQTDHSDGRSHRPCEQASAIFFMPSVALSIVEIVRSR